MVGIRAATVYASSVLLSLLVLGMYILGAARYLTNLEENTCEMTYMFEYPQYVRIALTEEIEERYPRYGLYVYGEGFITEKHRRMKFSGIPVLFVPGNAGSHEQVRSLASVSLRKSIKDRTPFHFDYFTISFGKDYSALYGGTLEDETAYVLLCISKILSLYRQSMDNIVLIGHSMGGVVAKAALSRGFASISLNKTVESSAGSILVTLAAPHRPIFLPDRTIARFYEDLERSEYRRMIETNSSFVSIGGGRRDTLVSPSQTIDTAADLNLLSSGIPGVWSSTDHRCILWCKQLVLAIVRALFDCVDTQPRPPRITSDRDAKFRALSYHFTSRILGKKMRASEDRIKFEGGAEWIEDIRQRYTWSRSEAEDTNKTVYLMIRVANTAVSYDSITIDAINLETRDWLFACSAYAIEGNSRVCEWGWNLTNRTRLSPDPTQRRSRKIVDLKSSDFEGWKISHIVVRIPAEELRNRKRSSFVRIHVDLYNRGNRLITLKDSLTTGRTALFNLFSIGGVWFPNPHGIATSMQGSLRYYAVLADIRDAIVVEIQAFAEATSATERSIRSESNDESPQALVELLEASSFDHGHTSSSQVRAIVTDHKTYVQSGLNVVGVHLITRGFMVYVNDEENMNVYNEERGRARN